MSVEGERRALYGIIAVLTAILCIAHCGCKATAQTDIEASPMIEAKVTAALAAVDELDSRVGTVETTIGTIDTKVDTKIGGDGDTITSWILAVCCGGAALFYPLIWRPLVKKTGMRKG